VLQRSTLRPGGQRRGGQIAVLARRRRALLSWKGC